MLFISSRLTRTYVLCYNKKAEWFTKFEGDVKHIYECFLTGGVRWQKE